MPQRFQFPANFLVVVNLPVEGDSRVAIAADEWLVTAAKVDNLQAHGTKRRHAAFEYALLVGTAMREGLRDAMGYAPAHDPIETCKSRDTTHFPLNSPFPERNQKLDPLCDGFLYLCRIYHNVNISAPGS
jgi:hypothetical protein